MSEWYLGFWYKAIISALVSEPGKLKLSFRSIVLVGFVLVFELQICFLRKGWSESIEENIKGCKRKAWTKTFVEAEIVFLHFSNSDERGNVTTA